ncbi:PhzF family phenazine biosynthesis protein [Agrobacterium vitis]|uniref:PhzF family phenazine biosynthesis protein n=1 Tax=Agrobacterium vitis TaxID=373 RepID=UPI0008725597|nr:PhzF family phenazine biosynthesis isomerase [Agrobacterium vitis]MCE6076842.1 PhzF family phenazine biosynthesis isomerase [Agrobacterium vitis]MCM2470824.1 PhzF family phenazine biosynthesis isomerase [Agrobacterium vitis]MUO71226.1 PhzF family phenazine biosynthesis isomerase [Agrobacterium vitis]MUO84310.1 PhzF family phenazine biosynthesis isomerase [Agrobacterium vitis]
MNQHPYPVSLVNVFTVDGRGGNPCPVVINAEEMSGEQMKAVAAAYGHESAFVRRITDGSFDLSMRFWVPEHEMEMCGHATIGSLWLLAKTGELPAGQVRIDTLSGAVSGFVSVSPQGEPRIQITQPAGKVVNLSREDERHVLDTLKLSRSDLLDLPIQNAVTSRVKTLIPLKEPERLHALVSEMEHTKACCAEIGSTGLYPFVRLSADTQSFEARQFPHSSGYPEDAATGIAAAALSFGLLEYGLVRSDDSPITVFQGRAMGRLSQITTRLGFSGGKPIGCLIGGDVQMSISHS